MKTAKIIVAITLTILAITAFVSAQETPATLYKDGPVSGRMIDTAFYPGDSNYHAIVHASDGFVYYAICTHERNTHVHLFRYDPKTGEATTVADIGEKFGEDPTVNIPQGKVHCDIFELDGKLYFGTHVGIYERGGTEDHGPYPGGHFASYDLATGAFHDYGIGVAEEGLVSMAIDKDRKRLYALTWPSAIFVYCDIASGEIKSFGPSVLGHAYINDKEFGGVPRSLAVDPRDGNVYYWNLGETVSFYDYAADTIGVREDHDLGRPILKVSMRNSENDQIMWRSIRWNDADQLFYGVMFWSEDLFTYDPRTGDIEMLDRIAPGPNKRTGEIFAGSLAFELSSDGTTVYYVNNLKGYAAKDKSQEALHLVTYNIPLRKYVDHGPIVLEDGRKATYCQGVEVGRDGNLYLVCNIPFTDFDSEKGRKIKDIRYKATPTEQLKVVYEINLVVVKDPLNQGE